MNCRPGDLAVIVRCQMHPPLIGTFVRVVRRVPDDYWYMDSPLPKPDGGAWIFIHDSCLRPIRDNDGEDEMLRIAGKPNEVTA